MTQQGKTFSGRRRRRTTTPAVKLANVTARVCITTGGLLTIVAVAVMCIFLFAVVVPLFLPGDVEDLASTEEVVEWRGEARHLQVNEYNTMSWIMDKAGTVHLLSLTTGEELAQFRPFGDRVPKALAFSLRGGHVAAGYADGSVQYGTVEFVTRYIEPAELPAELRERSASTPVVHDEGIVELTPEGQYRQQTIRLEFEAPTVLERGVPIELIDLSVQSDGPVLSAFSASNHLHIAEVSKRRNLLTGEVKVKLYGGELDLSEHMRETPPLWLGLTGLGDNAFLVWPDGRLLRVNARTAADMSVTETTNLVPEGDARISALGFLIGKTSLVSGDTEGRLRVWFRTKPEDAQTADGATLVMGHELPASGAEVTTVSASPRSRILAVGDANGRVDLHYATNSRRLAHIESTVASAGVDTMVMSPKEDALYVLGPGGLGGWKLNIPHPEISLNAILGKVWYEGYNGPEHVWQSSSGTDTFEPKYGLMPLIFGTIKATVFSMLFAVPIALLAAVYSSEIMPPRLRSRVKPTIEMMASLPSVVLGFLAALVIAPYAEDVVPALLASFVTIPFALLLGAHVWQMLPPHLLTVLRRYRLLATAVAGACGVYLGTAAGPLAERLFFAGDLKHWLANHDKGSGAGGWLLVLLPSAVFALWLINHRWVLCRWRRITRLWSRPRFVTAELLRYLLNTAVVFAVAWLGARLLADGIGWDPRGSFVDTYVQRNAMIVGFVMGFAVIPIIYTLTEDALGSVPEQLRAASLGAGATPWQTATRIILPTAGSGIFSAVMIGFGRAVGETMIVLMAAGNTPLMDWNLFNGFRTLSANIAVELPEAVKGSTHYRMLFLAALALFIMTFVLNSCAELIRQRVRKRAYQL